MKQETNNNIKCDVKSCEYHNQDLKCCNLNEIKVSCTCNSNKDSVNDKEETICATFKKKEV